MIERKEMRTDVGMIRVNKKKTKTKINVEFNRILSSFFFVLFLDTYQVQQS